MVSRFFTLLFLIPTILVLFSGNSEAAPIAEGDNVILYALGDGLHEDDFRVNVYIPVYKNADISYSYSISDPDPDLHNVFLEVYYTTTEWTSNTMPDVSLQRHFKRGNSYSDNFKIKDEEVGYYLFIWDNDGSGECIMDYEISYFINNQDPNFCTSAIIPVSIGVMAIISISLGRKRKNMDLIKVPNNLSYIFSILWRIISSDTSTSG